MRRFIVIVPKALMRSGPFGWLGRQFGQDGKATKFGDDMFYTLRRLQGVEPSLSNRTPHILIVHIDNTTAEDPPEGFYHQSHGLPASVCVTIETVILRNNGLVQVIAEGLRRLF